MDTSFDLEFDENTDTTENINTSFDYKDFLGYYYEEYVYFKSKLDYDAGDINSRCLVIEILHTALFMRMHLYDLNNESYKLTTNDIQEIIKIMQKHLQPLINSNTSKNTSKKLQYIYYITLLLDGECSILSGDFADAIKSYSKVLKDWDDLDEDNELFKVDLIYSLFAILRLLDLKDLIDKYYNLYKPQIEYVKKFYSKDEFYTAFNEKQLEKYQNKYYVNEYATLSTGNSDDSMFDRGINSWGYIDIEYGFYKIDINKEKDYLYFFSKDQMSNQEKETILVEKISNVIEVQRNKILESL